MPQSPSSPLFDLTDSRILITGSNGGLGLSLAHGLAALGATVILNGRDSAKLRRAAAAIAAEGGLVEESRFDVASEAEVSAAMSEIEKQGGLDVLINNAGITYRKSLEQVPLESWENVMRVNLTGAFIVGRAAANVMIPRKRGKIINICSVMSELGRPTIGSYTATKGGLKMLTKAMCADWARFNIQVNGIAPGYFATELTRPLAEDPEFDSWVKRRTPAGRWGQGEDLIGAAVFLSSKASAFVNGQILFVDGGMTAVV